MKQSIVAWMLVLALGLVGCAPGEPVEAPARSSGLGLPARFTALGTEPFWAAKVDGTALLYQTPEDEGGKRTTLTRREWPDRIELAGSLSGKLLLLKITLGPCSDGMSDTLYSYSAELRIGAELLRGCAKSS